MDQSMDDRLSEDFPETKQKSLSIHSLVSKQLSLASENIGIKMDSAQYEANGISDSLGQDHGADTNNAKKISNFSRKNSKTSNQSISQISSKKASITFARITSISSKHKHKQSIPNSSENAKSNDALKAVELQEDDKFSQNNLNAIDQVDIGIQNHQVPAQDGVTNDDSQIISPQFNQKQKHHIIQELEMKKLVKQNTQNLQNRSIFEKNTTYQNSNDSPSVKKKQQRPSTTMHKQMDYDDVMVLNKGRQKHHRYGSTGSKAGSSGSESGKQVKNYKSYNRLQVQDSQNNIQRINNYITNVRPRIDVMRAFSSNSNSQEKRNRNQRKSFTSLAERNLKSDAILMQMSGIKRVSPILSKNRSPIGNKNTFMTKQPTGKQSSSSQHDNIPTQKFLQQNQESAIMNFGSDYFQQQAKSVLPGPMKGKYVRQQYVESNLNKHFTKRGVKVSKTSMSQTTGLDSNMKPKMNDSQLTDTALKILMNEYLSNGISNKNHLGINKAGHANQMTYSRNPGYNLSINSYKRIRKQQLSQTTKGTKGQGFILSQPQVENTNADNLTGQLRNQPRKFHQSMNTNTDQMEAINSAIMDIQQFKKKLVDGTEGQSENTFQGSAAINYPMKTVKFKRNLNQRAQSSFGARPNANQSLSNNIVYQSQKRPSEPSMSLQSRENISNIHKIYSMKQRQSENGALSDLTGGENPVSHNQQLSQLKLLGYDLETIISKKKKKRRNLLIRGKTGSLLQKYKQSLLDQNQYKEFFEKIYNVFENEVAKGQNQISNPANQLQECNSNQSQTDTKNNLSNFNIPNGFFSNNIHHLTINTSVPQVQQIQANSALTPNQNIQPMPHSSFDQQTPKGNMWFKEPSLQHLTDQTFRDGQNKLINSQQRVIDLNDNSGLVLIDNLKTAVDQDIERHADHQSYAQMNNQDLKIINDQQPQLQQINDLKIQQHKKEVKKNLGRVLGKKNELQELTQQRNELTEVVVKQQPKAFVKNFDDFLDMSIAKVNDKVETEDIEKRKKVLNISRKGELTQSQQKQQKQKKMRIQNLGKKIKEVTSNKKSIVTFQEEQSDNQRGVENEDEQEWDAEEQQRLELFKEELRKSRQKNNSSFNNKSSHQTTHKSNAQQDYAQSIPSPLIFEEDQINNLSQEKSLKIDIQQMSKEGGSDQCIEKDDSNGPNVVTEDHDHDGSQKLSTLSELENKGKHMFQMRMKDLRKIENQIFFDEEQNQNDSDDLGLMQSLDEHGRSLNNEDQNNLIENQEPQSFRTSEKMNQEMSQNDQDDYYQQQDLNMNDQYVENNQQDYNSNGQEQEQVQQEEDNENVEEGEDYPNTEQSQQQNDQEQAQDQMQEYNQENVEQSQDVMEENGQGMVDENEQMTSQMLQEVQNIQNDVEQENEEVFDDQSLYDSEDEEEADIISVDQVGKAVEEVIKPIIVISQEESEMSKYFQQQCGKTFYSQRVLLSQLPSSVEQVQLDEEMDEVINEYQDDFNLEYDQPDTRDNLQCWRALIKCDASFDMHLNKYVDKHKEDELQESISNLFKHMHLVNNDLNTINKRQKRRQKEVNVNKIFKFRKRIFTNNFVQLIRSHDIHQNFIIDRNMGLKIQQLKMMIKEIGNHLFPISVEEFSMRLIENKIQNLIERTQEQMIFISRLDNQVAEEDVITIFKVNDNIEDNQKQERQMIQYEEDMELINIYSQYADIVQTQKNNKMAFIIHQNTEYLEKLDQSISLFDVQTKTSTLKILYEFDWKKIAQREADYIIKQFKQQIKFGKVFTDSIAEVLKQRFNLEDNIYTKTVATKDEMLIKTPRKIMNNLADSLECFEIRYLPVSVRFKTAICTTGSMKYIKNYIISLVFEDLLKSMDHIPSFANTQNVYQRLENFSDRLKLPSFFEQYIASAVIDKNGNSSMKNLIFHHQKISLFKILYDPSHDYILATRLKNLEGISKKTFFSKMINDNNHGLQYQIYYPDLMKFPKPKRSNSISTTKSCLDQVALQKYRHFWKDIQDISQDYNSDREGYPDQRVVVREPHHMGALNIYNREYCRFKISQELQKKINSIKDRNSMFYKSVFNIINEEDQDYNLLMRQFGYKCTFIKDPIYNMYIMEILTPIVRVKGEEKISQMNHFNMQTTKGKISQFKDFKNDEVSVKYDERQKQVLPDLIMDEFQVQDIETDGSMKGVTYDDIKSECSLDGFGSDEEPKRKNSRSLSKPRTSDNRNNIALHNWMCSHTTNVTPLQYYKNLAKKKFVDYNQEDISPQDQIMDEKSILKNDPAHKSVFKLMNEDELMDEQSQSGNAYGQMRNRYKIEKMVYQQNMNVQNDNFDEIKKLVSNIQYARRQRLTEIRRLGSEDQYLKSGASKVIDANIRKIENSSIAPIRKYHESLTWVKGQTMNAEQEFIKNFLAKLELNQKEYLRSDRGDKEEQKKFKFAKEDKPMQEIKEKIAPKQDNEQTFGSCDDEDSLSIGSTPKSKPLILQKKKGSLTNNWTDHVHNVLGSGILSGMQDISSLEQDNKYKVLLNKIIEDKLKKNLHDSDSDFDLENEVIKMKEHYLHNNRLMELKQKKIQQRSAILAGIQSNKIKQVMTYSKKQQNDQIEKFVIKINKKLKHEKCVNTSFHSRYEFINLEKNKKIPPITTQGSIEEKDQSEPLAHVWNDFQPLIFDTQSSDDGQQLKTIAVGKKPVRKNQLHSSTLSDFGQNSRQSEDTVNLLTESQKFSISEKSKLHKYKNKRIQDSMIQLVHDMNIKIMTDALKSFQGNVNNIRDPSGNTLLILACRYSDYKMVYLLINNGVNVNIKNSDGNTCMHYAASVKSYKCLRALIEGGADENLENNDGKTPWELF